VSAPQLPKRVTTANLPHLPTANANPGLARARADAWAALKAAEDAEHAASLKRTKATTLVLRYENLLAEANGQGTLPL